jgi:sugar phosphate isomerase/epimerase
MSRNLAVSTALFDGYDMALAFDEIAAAGCQRVEPAFIAGYTDFTEATFSETTARQLAKQAKLAGVTIAAVSAHMDLGAADVETSARLERRIHFVSACGSKVLISNAGLAQDADRIAQRLELVVPLCEQLGIMLALENPGHGTGSLIHDVQSGQAFLERFEHSSVRLNYDAGNVYSYSGGIQQPGNDLVEGGQRGIGYVHLKDLKLEAPDWIFCPIGEGDVNFSELLHILEPDIPVSIELPLRLRRPGKGDPVRQREAIPLPALRTAMRDSLRAVAVAQR